MKNSISKLLKHSASLFALQMLVLAVAFGQRYGQTAESFKEPAFSVLWNNADLTNKKLFVEIMYEKNTCFHDAAEFWMYKKDEPTGGRRVKVDSLLNNQKNCTLSADSFILSNPTAGGYRLRFALTDADTVASDSVRIRVVSKYQTYFSCKDCGAAKSEITIDSTSIHPDCPYNNVNYDLLACSRRTGGAKNWEAFVVDHRDCKIYRAVAMPFLNAYNKGQGRWWLAQNLNYTKNLVRSNYSVLNSSSPADPAGTYWCPNSQSFLVETGAKIPDLVSDQSYNGDPYSGHDSVCNVYGAMYQLPIAMSRNGLAPNRDDFQGVNTWSLAQGICPKGWVIPARKDWSVMYNFVEGCTDDAKAQASVENTEAAFAAAWPCVHHNTTSAAGNPHGLANEAFQSGAPQKFMNVLSGHRTLKEDSVFAKPNKPIWPWYGVGSKRMYGARPTDYYGFSVLPSGLRRNYNNSSTKVGYLYAVGRVGLMFTSTASSESVEAAYFNYTYRHLYRTTYYAESAPTRDAGAIRCVRAYNLDQ
ncbi:MAG: FISUMP domain-containing protein [Bacteroidales bacterium]